MQRYIYPIKPFTAEGLEPVIKPYIDDTNGKGIIFVSQGDWEQIKTQIVMPPDDILTEPWYPLDNITPLARNFGMRQADFKTPLSYLEWTIYGSTD